MAILPDQTHILPISASSVSLPPPRTNVHPLLPPSPPFPHFLSPLFPPCDFLESRHLSMSSLALLCYLIRHVQSESFLPFPLSSSPGEQEMVAGETICDTPWSSSCRLDEGSAQCSHHQSRRETHQSMHRSDRTKHGLLLPSPCFFTHDRYFSLGPTL